MAADQAQTQRKRGRPSKKGNLDLKKVEKLARMGWTDAQMADFFDVDERTWHRWKAADEEFRQALKEWKDEADARVERSLYERATGYSHPDVHISNYQGHITITPVIKRYPPDTTAAIFWLKNRKPAEWRDKQEQQHEANDTLAQLLREISRQGSAAPIATQSKIR